MKKIFIALLIFGFITVPTITIWAQDVSTGIDVDENESVITLTRERETQKIQDLRILYRDQVDVYRNSEKSFVIAKTNYIQVQTLAALEEAVKSTKTVMLDRSRVLITYLELIDAVLLQTGGVELDLKNQSHTELTGLINLLKIHQENIIVSSDRQSMEVLADEFEPITPNYQSAVYKTLSLIRIGKIQEIHDKAEIIHQDIISEHQSQEVSGVVISRRERAYAEIERNFDTINGGLFELNNLFLEARRDGFSRSFFERILEDLTPIYVEISRSLDHLEELITL